MNDSLILQLPNAKLPLLNLTEWLGQLVVVVVRLSHHHHRTTWLV
jgi:hypothetical protein